MKLLCPLLAIHFRLKSIKMKVFFWFSLKSKTRSSHGGTYECIDRKINIVFYIFSLWVFNKSKAAFFTLPVNVHDCTVGLGLEEEVT